MDLASAVSRPIQVRVDPGTPTTVALGLEPGASLRVRLAAREGNSRRVLAVLFEGEWLQRVPLPAGTDSTLRVPAGELEFFHYPWMTGASLLDWPRLRVRLEPGDDRLVEF